MELVVALRQPADVLLVCLDSNSRIGRNPGTHWGPIGAEHPNSNTPHFESTWTSPAGHRARLDFVAVPCALSASVQASKVDTDFDHLLSHSDHDAVCVSLRLRCVSKGRQPSAPRRLHVDPEVQAVWQAEVAAAPLALGLLCGSPSVSVVGHSSYRLKALCLGWIFAFRWG